MNLHRTDSLLDFKQSYQNRLSGIFYSAVPFPSTKLQGSYFLMLQHFQVGTRQCLTPLLPEFNPNSDNGKLHV